MRCIQSDLTKNSRGLSCTALAATFLLAPHSLMRLYVALKSQTRWAQVSSTPSIRRTFESCIWVRIHPIDVWSLGATRDTMSCYTRKVPMCVYITMICRDMCVSSTVCKLDDHTCQCGRAAMLDRQLDRFHLRQGLAVVQAFPLDEACGVDSLD